MKYISVCSGIEAATVAWHGLGWEPLAFSEIEPFPSRVLAHHYPNVPNLGDMTKYKEWPNYEPDLLVGGTPCQSFSIAGLRKGLDDPRGNLMLTYLGIADKYKPRYLLWENVPGVLSSNGGRDFGTFLQGLAQLGYGFAYRVLDAQYCRTHEFYGAVPQRRRRVFVVGCLGSWQRAAAVLFDSESLRGNPPPSRKTRKEITSIIGTSTYECGGIGQYSSSSSSSPLRRTGADLGPGCEALIMSHGQANAEISVGFAPTLNCNHEQPIAFTARDYGADATYGVTPTMRSLAQGIDGHQSGGAGLAICLPINMQAAIKTGEKSPNMLGIGNDGDPAPTINASDRHAVAFNANARPDEMKFEDVNGGLTRSQSGAIFYRADNEYAEFMRLCDVPINDAVAQPLRSNGFNNSDPMMEAKMHLLNTSTMQVRRLTPLECERLQGFSDSYTNIPSASDTTRYKALGNSMAVNVMQLLGQRITMVDALSIDPIVNTV